MERLNMNEIAEGSVIHFIGIGGISMSGLAQVALRRGYKITGSDRSESNITKKLEQLGATIHIGHSAKNVGDAVLVVHTAAVHDDNPEIIEAKSRNIRLVDRAEFLGAIMKEFTNAVGVAGTHGKTTTTGMLAHALVYADTDPTISIGGELDLIDGNIRCGDGDCFVTEACEYTNSFLKFYPTIALITNIEEDHLDFFSGIEEIRESFRNYAMLTAGKGSVVAMWDDENVRTALDGCDGLNIIKYGMTSECDYYPENIVTNAGYPAYDVMCKGEKICHISLNVPGNHNILNSLATVAVCCEMGTNPETAAKGIETFKGTHRRFEKRGMLNGAIVIDDYAHHPTEIKATLNAAKEFPHNRIICIFQPHTYSRTRTLWAEFLEAFDDADELIITHIFAAREAFDGVTRPEKLTEEIASRGINARYIDAFSDIVKEVRESAEDGDIIFTMGAGDVTEIGYELVK